MPGADAAERRAAARAHVPAAFLELFEERLPAMAAELAAGRTGLLEGVSLYHMLLEGVVFDAGQKALLDDLERRRPAGGAARASSAWSATSAGTSASACAA